jgi:hypothetical protein
MARSIPSALQAIPKVDSQRSDVLATGVMLGPNGQKVKLVVWRGLPRTVDVIVLDRRGVVISHEARCTLDRLQGVLREVLGISPSSEGFPV